MTGQPDNWLDDVPSSAEKNENDEIIWVSKSEIKRDAEVLKKLGAELVNLSKNELERIPLDDDLLTAIELAQKIKREGRRRQLQLIGKLLRSRDETPIIDALDRLKNRHNQQVLMLHKIEDLRERLMAKGDQMIEEVVGLFPMTDRQKLRSLVRNAQKEKETTKPPKAYRQLFQYLKELSETA